MPHVETVRGPARTGPRPGWFAGTERWLSFAYGLIWLMAMCIPWGDMILLPYEVQASRLLTVATALVWALLLWRKRKAKDLRAAHWLLLLFVTWAAANVLWSPETDRSLRRVASYLQLFLLVWVIHQSCDTILQYLRLLQAYVIGCLIATTGLFWNFMADVVTGDGRYTAPGFDPNDLAVTLALGIPMAWHLDSMTRGLRWLNRLFVPIAVICILLTASRSGLVTLAISMAYLLTTITRFSRRSILGLVLVGGLTISVVTAMWSEVSIRRLSTIADQLTARDMNGRVDIWERGVAAFLEHPLVGHGAGSFGAVVGARRSRELAAHNAYLGILVEHGLIGLALFLSAVGAIYARALRSYPMEPRLWTFLLLGWAVAAMSLSWENRETSWLLFGLGAALPRKPRPALHYLMPSKRRDIGVAYA
jgi:O-antigen ligase